MSLGINVNRNATDFFRTGSYDRLNAITNPGGVRVCLFTDEDGENIIPLTGLYLDRTGQFQTLYLDVSIISQPSKGVVRFDPAFVNTVPGTPPIFASPTDPIARASFALGAYLPSNNTGRMYRTEVSLGEVAPADKRWQEVNYLDSPYTVLGGGSDIFPQIFAGNPRNLTSTEVGYWSYANNKKTNSVLFFEGWDHDNSGNTVGTMVLGVDRTRLVAGVSNLEVDNPSKSLTFVNLATGFGTPIAEMPFSYRLSPQNIYQGSALFGVETNMSQLQWVPDLDSTLAAPKGRIFMSGHDVDVDTENFFILMYDFNPTGKAGSPTRVHFNLSFQTRVTTAPSVDFNQVPPAASSNVIMTSNVSFNENAPMFNSSNGRVTMLGSLASGFSNVLGTAITEYDNATFSQNSLELTTNPVVSSLQPPLPRQPVTTNRTTTFGSEAIGDLGEPVPSVDVNWTLEPISTKNEFMNIPTVSIPADPYTAVHFPIDPDPLFPLEIREDDLAGSVVVLVLGTDYTINGSGQVDFDAGFFLDISKQYEIDYGHPAFVTDPQNPLTPFGTLLINSSQSDDTGEATTRVQYPDDVTDAGFVDKLTVAD